MGDVDMSVDLKELSVDSLRELVTDANREIEWRGVQKRKAVVSEIKLIAEKAGMTLYEAAAFEQKVRGTRPPKYRNPGNSGQTWCGRGKRPRWLRDALGSGIAIDELLVSATRI